MTSCRKHVPRHDKKRCSEPARAQSVEPPIVKRMISDEEIITMTTGEFLRFIGRTRPLKTRRTVPQHAAVPRRGSTPGKCRVVVKEPNPATSQQPTVTIRKTKPASVDVFKTKSKVRAEATTNKKVHFLEPLRKGTTKSATCSHLNAFTFGARPAPPRLPQIEKRRRRRRRDDGDEDEDGNAMRALQAKLGLHPVGIIDI